eukprot:2787044-Amphidinium_carterae.1
MAFAGSLPLKFKREIACLHAVPFFTQTFSLGGCPSCSELPSIGWTRAPHSPSLMISRAGGVAPLAAVP